MTAGSTGSQDGRISFGTLSSLFGFRLRLAQMRLFQHFRDSLAEFDITPGQAGLLILVHDNPGISQSSLARAIEVERATLGQSIDRLVKRGLVLRERNDSDRRAYALVLSGQGHDFVARLIPAIRRHEAALAANLTESEFAMLEKLLARFLGDKGRGEEYRA
ncbi:MAG: hypothetical protein Tsb008_22310 [Rhodothalassiaceae bacterium]